MLVKLKESKRKRESSNKLFLHEPILAPEYFEGSGVSGGLGEREIGIHGLKATGFGPPRTQKL